MGLDLTRPARFVTHRRALPIVTASVGRKRKAILIRQAHQLRCEVSGVGHQKIRREMTFATSKGTFHGGNQIIPIPPSAIFFLT